MNSDGDSPQAIAYGTPEGRWILGVAVGGSAMVFLDATVVNVALAHIGRDLHATTAALQWILNGYLLTLAALILVGGSLGDRYGRRRVFVLGVALFTLSSLLCALAPSAETLAGARFVQGVGGALLTPGSLAMLESTFRREDRARAIGAWTGLTGVATALGPVLGGVLVTAVSWRAIFLLNLPVGLVVGILAHRRIPETRAAAYEPARRHLPDLPGAALAALGLAALTYALVEAPTSHGGVSIIVTAVAGALLLAGFVAREHAAPDPMLPLGIFRARQFTAANLVTLVVYAALSGVLFLLVAFLQIALGYSAVEAGASTLPVTALMLAFSSRSGDLAQRIGPRLPLTLGPTVIAAGLLLMTRINPGDSYPASVLPPVIVFGCGLSLTVAPITATVLAAAPVEHAGVASAVNNAVSRVAGLLAVALLPLAGNLAGHRFYERAAMTHGFHVGMVVCAGLAVAGGLTAAATIRRLDGGSAEPDSGSPASVPSPAGVGTNERAAQPAAQPR